MTVSLEYLERCSGETGYPVGALEKVVRLGELTADVARHALLGPALVLKGGTALNLCFGPPHRLSVDLDFNYIRHLARQNRTDPEVSPAVNLQNGEVRSHPTHPAGRATQEVSGKWNDGSVVGERVGSAPRANHAVVTSLRMTGVIPGQRRESTALNARRLVILKTDIAATSRASCA